MRRRSFLVDIFGLKATTDGNEIKGEASRALCLTSLLNDTTFSTTRYDE